MYWFYFDVFILFVRNIFLPLNKFLTKRRFLPKSILSFLFFFFFCNSMRNIKILTYTQTFFTHDLVSEIISFLLNNNYSYSFRHFRLMWITPFRRRVKLLKNYIKSWSRKSILRVEKNRQYIQHQVDLSFNKPKLNFQTICEKKSNRVCRVAKTLLKYFYICTIFVHCENNNEQF